VADLSLLFQRTMDFSNRPIVGKYRDLANLVRQRVGGMSSRTAARRAQVSYNTILKMVDGDRPKADLIIKFAEGFEEDPVALLKLAGYPVGSDAQDAENRRGAPGMEEWILLYDQLSPGQRLAARRFLKEIAESYRTE
jgi:hypothetical protein